MEIGRKTPPKYPHIDDVPGAVLLRVVYERMPCGIGMTSTWIGDNGETMKQNFTAFVARGVVADGVAQLV